MIQRPQSLYLAGIIMIIGVLCFGSMIEQWDNAAGQRYSLNLQSFSIYTTSNTALQSSIQWMTLVPAILLALFTGLIIFSFKDRQKQLKLCKWNYLLIILLLVLAFSNAFRNIPNFSIKAAFNSSVFGYLLSVFLLYLNFRAQMLIRKDEELVRSADRIR